MPRDDWECWAVREPGDEQWVEWARFHHREGLMAAKVSKAADLKAAWAGRPWNLRAIFWRDAPSSVVNFPTT